MCVCSHLHIISAVAYLLGKVCLTSWTALILQVKLINLSFYVAHWPTGSRSVDHKRVGPVEGVVGGGGGGFTNHAPTDWAKTEQHLSQDTIRLSAVSPTESDATQYSHSWHGLAGWGHGPKPKPQNLQQIV